MSDSPDTFVIDEVRDHYFPGETIRGEVLWDLSKDTEEVTLSLGWWTSGAGTKDESIFDFTSWTTPPRIGKETFAFTLPPGPFSFSGRLISLEWALELTAKKLDGRSVQTFILSPTGQELDFSDRNYESQIKSLSVRNR